MALAKSHDAWDIAEMAEQVNTAAEVIDLLGGNVALAKTLGLDSRVVTNWRERGLPPSTFYALTNLLNAKGYYAPPSLWRQREIAAS